MEPFLSQGASVDFMTEIWSAAKAAGPFATMIMVFLWWRADGERLKLQTERDALLERMIKGMYDNTGAISAIRDLFIKASGRQDA